MGLSEQITELQGLLEAGGISQEEFEAAKRRLLGIPAGPAVARNAAPGGAPVSRSMETSRGPAHAGRSSAGTGRADLRGGFLIVGALVLWLAWLLFSGVLGDLPGLLPNFLLFGGQVLFFGWPLIAMAVGALLYFMSTGRAEIRGLMFGTAITVFAVSTSWLSYGGASLLTTLLGVISAGLMIGSVFFWRKR